MRQMSLKLPERCLATMARFPDVNQMPLGQNHRCNFQIYCTPVGKTLPGARFGLQGICVSLYYPACYPNWPQQIRKFFFRVCVLRVTGNSVLGD